MEKFTVRRLVLVIALISVFTGGYLMGTSSEAAPHSEQKPKQTICVEGTFLQSDNTCLPPDSITMKDK